MSRLYDAAVPWRGIVALAGAFALLGGCGVGQAYDLKGEQRFLNSVYSQAPDISSYRSSAQLLSLGEVICEDLAAGASVGEVGDRVPLVEGNVALPPADLGAVISSAATLLCPRFEKELSQ